ncbi:MAG: GTP-binding protein, partial [Candidatus Accumulibacter sp.]|nr:GTP-binding protein [Accumulibacter sp.]
MGQNDMLKLRTVALVGHGSSGKTTLAETLLAASGAISGKGSVEKGNTVCDFDPQEKELGHSINSAIGNFTWLDTQIQFIDTPGYPDFAGQAIGALAAVDTALVVINAQTGIELTTDRMMRLAGARGLCRMIVINRIDVENIDLPKLVDAIRERFGNECMLLNLPANQGKEVVDVLAHDDGESDFDSVAAAHRALIDQIVEEDEALLDKYLEDGEDPSAEDLHAPLEKALREGHLVPILFVSARTGAGVPQLLDTLARLTPNPQEANPAPFFKGPAGAAEDTLEEIVPDPGKHIVAHVFKIVSDPFIGKLGVFRVHQGTIRKDSQLFVGENKRPAKVGHLLRLQGKENTDVDALFPGEIGAIAKVEEIEFDSVLHDSHEEDQLHLKPLEFPEPMHGLAVQAQKKADEQRLFDVLRKL